MNEWHQLVEQTIAAVDALRRAGVRHVDVRPETLAALAMLPATAAAVPNRPGRGRTELTTPASAAAAPVATPAARSARVTVAGSKDWAALTAQAQGCQKCAELARCRKNVVFGVGNAQAELMFIGEAPGADEDEQGEPFVGRAGQLLTKIIEAMGYRREEVYIANVLKCRPPNNRVPLPEEVANCLPFLLAQIDAVKPKAMVALGATAVRSLLNVEIGITKMRGNWYEFHGTPLMPTFHPAYLLRNPAAKKEVWEDMQIVLAKLGRPVPKKGAVTA